MATYPAPDGGNKKRLWTGRILGGLVVAFLLFDAGSTCAMTGCVR